MTATTTLPVVTVADASEENPWARAWRRLKRRKGAMVFAAEHGQPNAGRLPVLPPEHPDVDAVCLIQTFYALAVRIAVRRGTNADQPRHLQKVTRTR